MKTAKAKINLDDDIKMLLDKCKKDPKRAKKYASIILEIDSKNKEAKAILSKR